MPLSRLANHKIRPDHLDRQALIYVRQSTLLQVRANTGSTARQYDLVPRALDLGWPRERIRVIDQDPGQCRARQPVHRDGFQWLVAEVGLKHAGAVFCLEASRLARSCSDWYHLLEICALTDTLVVDEEGIYDPGQYLTIACCWASRYPPYTTQALHAAYQLRLLLHLPSTTLKNIADGMVIKGLAFGTVEALGIG